MAKRNERGAGRKQTLGEAEIAEIRKRRDNGETVTALAQEYGVSRQTLSGYLSRKDEEMEHICRTYRKWAELNHRFRNVETQDYMVRMDFMCEDECCTQILVDFKRERIEIVNTTDDIIHRAFGVKAKPTWEDFMEFLESRCFPRTRDHLRLVLKDLELDSYDPMAIVEKTKGRMAEDFQWLEITYYQPQNK